MTYDEALTKVRATQIEGRPKMVRRPAWPPQIAITLMPDDTYEDDWEHLKPGWVDSEDGFSRWTGEYKPVRFELDNLEGDSSGFFGDFKPTQEDTEAEDWELYDKRKLHPR